MPNIKVLRWLTLALFAAFGIFIALTFNHYGISNDEEVQHTYGRLLLDFYGSGFSDQDAFKYRNLYLYGGFFDLIAAILERILPIWVWDLRHLLSGMFGFLGVLGAYKIARLLGGERAGLIAILLLMITGAWSGAMFTHTKDVPFATCLVWALYYTMLVAQQLPAPPFKLTLKLGVAIGCALGMRIGGVFAVFYLVLAIVLAAWLQANGIHQRLVFLGNAIKSLLPAAGISLVLMAIFWPWSVMGPDHILQAAKAFSHFAFNMLTIMNGEVMNIGEVPRDYLPAYLLVRLPEVFLLGLVSLLVVGLVRFKQFDLKSPLALEWFALVVAAIFPLTFILLDKPALYNGVRHFTFIIPPLAILAALGLSATWEALHHRPQLRIALAATLALLTSSTVYTLLKLHPYEYVYYNHLAGSVSVAETRWEGDYWSSSLREAAEILESKIPAGEIDGDGLNHAPYRVAVCAESIQGQAYLDHRFQVTTDWISADFFISSTNMNCDKVLKGKIIGKVERLGATLAVVKDRRELLHHERMPTPAPR